MTGISVTGICALKWFSRCPPSPPLPCSHLPLSHSHSLPVWLECLNTTTHLQQQRNKSLSEVNLLHFFKGLEVCLENKSGAWWGNKVVSLIIFIISEINIFSHLRPDIVVRPNNKMLSAQCVVIFGRFIYLSAKSWILPTTKGFIVAWL